MLTVVYLHTPQELIDQALRQNVEVDLVPVCAKLYPLIPEIEFEINNRLGGDAIVILTRCREVLEIDKLWS